MIASSAMRGRQFFFFFGGGERTFFDPKAVNAHSLQPAQKVNADCAHTEGNEGEGRRTVSVSLSLSLTTCFLGCRGCDMSVERRTTTAGPRPSTVGSEN